MTGFETDWYDLIKDGWKLEEGLKLFDDTYLFRFDKFLAIVKTDPEGKIVKVSTFGKKEG